MRLIIREQKRSILEEELLGFHHQIWSNLGGYFGVILVLFWKENLRRISGGFLEALCAFGGAAAFAAFIAVIAIFR